ncbi:kinesin-like protein KIF28P [Asterias rubens]|uniref:kinesin-like protein KIF28P n=1 Tax=Asterias rubens TaxID=7604 RepID=UPI0014553BD2|nr:kinesin-like protein KIF28P [Asterias rubens]
MPEESVKVAVRVRPFNGRESARGAQLIIGMNGTTTTIQNPAAVDEEPKKFDFDYSYWSHDGFENKNELLVPTSPKYDDQNKVFKDLGVGILQNAWDGYNSCLFAYGQTGSGKSYSIVGYGPNKGVVPMFCDRLFVEINEKRSCGTKAEYEVMFSMLEIYNEQVRDLLNPAGNKKGGLRVREHPKKGFYVEQLRNVAVESYQHIEDRMDEGTRNRTVAATQMNATSSRAHTIVGITFTQKSVNDAGQEMAKVAVVNLVDLAGSERAESTGATGDRLKEGAAINQSLSSLGNVISALADRSKGKKVKVPFRDSVLTKLLKNALGGNSKTIMIAALSPADINYEETLSTLRYADRAKQIKTSAVVNEDPTEKLIRELKEENARLMDAIKKGGLVMVGDDDDRKEGVTDEERAAIRKELEEEMQARLEATERELGYMKESWEEKLSKEKGGEDDGERAKKEAKKTTPHLYNLNQDTQLSGMIVFLLNPGSYKVGNNKAESAPEILLNGLSIQKEHAVVVNENGKVFLEKASSDAKLLVNGDTVIGKIELDHNDRIMFGSNHLYVFQHPAMYKAKPTNYVGVVTYDSAQEEIAKKNGFDMTSNKSKDDLLLQEDLVELIPAVEEANAISEELDQKCKFEIVVMSAKARGLAHGRTEVCAKLRNLEKDLEYIWSRDKFVRRKYLMQEMYQNYTEGEEWTLPDEKNPFTEPIDKEVLVGTVNVYMQSLAYLIESKEQLDITDYRGKEQGLLDVELVPCDKKGNEIKEDDDLFIDHPNELVGRDLNFVVKINGALGIPSRYTSVHCKYNVFLDTEMIDTSQIQGTSNPNFKHKKKFNFTVVTSNLVQYLLHDHLVIQIWGTQKASQDGKKTKKNTKEIMQAEAINKARDVNGSGVNLTLDAETKAKNMFQFAIMKKRQERMEAKIAQFRKVVATAEKHNKARVETMVLKTVLNAQNAKMADMAIARIPKDDAGGNLGEETQKSGVCVVM